MRLQICFRNSDLSGILRGYVISSVPGCDTSVEGFEAVW